MKRQMQVVQEHLHFCSGGDSSADEFIIVKTKYAMFCDERLRKLT